MDSIEVALNGLMNDMYGRSSYFVGLGQALGGLGAIMYIFIRIWGHLARNEEIEITPLFRPVALAMCLLFYKPISGSIVKISQQMGTGTRVLVTSQLTRVNQLIANKQALIKDRTLRLATDMPAIETSETGSNQWYMDKLFNNSISNWVNEKATTYFSSVIDDIIQAIGEVFFNTAGILIKFLQTFFLLVLLITGPLTIGLSCFEWFYSGLAAWLGRIIHLVLWMPLVNIVGGMLQTVHIKMLEADIAQINATPNDVFTLTDTTMLAFYLLGTVAYTMVPLAASWVIESSGVGDAVGKATGGVKSAGAAAGGAAGAAGGALRGGMARVASMSSRSQNSI